MNSNGCTHFEYAATPEQGAHIARALLAHPTPSALARFLRVGATGWSRLDQPGAFASQRRSVKNWMRRESGHPGLSGSHGGISCVGATGRSLVGRLGAFASWRGSVKNWMDSRVEHPGLVGSCAYCSRLDNWLVTGRPTGGFRFSARKRQKLDGPGVPHPGLGGGKESVLGKRCRTSTTSSGDLNCTLLNSWRGSSRFKSRRCGWRSHVSEKLRHTELCGRPSNGIAAELGVLWEVRGGPANPQVSSSVARSTTSRVSFADRY